jgi:hypothetical protein
MTDYFVAALGATRPEDLYICFRRPVRSDGVCWPLPWAGAWSEAEVVRAAAELNDGVEMVAVPRDIVHALATPPPPGKIDGDVGPVVRNSASNRRALIVAARRDIARMEAFEIPPADDALRGDESVIKALAALLPLLGREDSIEDDRVWQLRADLLALLHSDDRRRIQRTVKAVHDIAGKAEMAAPATKPPQRPMRPTQAPGQAEVTILRSPPPSVPPPPPSPDTEVGGAIKS